MKLTTQKTPIKQIELTMLLYCLGSFSVPIRKIKIIIFKHFGINVNNHSIILIMYIYNTFNDNNFKQLDIISISGFTNYNLQYLKTRNLVLIDITKTRSKYILNPLLINELNTQFEYIFKSLQKKVKLI